MSMSRGFLLRVNKRSYNETIWRYIQKLLTVGKYGTMRMAAHHVSKGNV